MMAGCASPAPHKLESALPTVSIEAPPPPRAGAQVITVSAVGDCALGDLQHGAGAPGSMSAHLDAVDDAMAYPFSRVREVLAHDDLTIANLEGVLTERRGFQNDVF
ncbi:MAG TPA: hypothetical protein VFB62_21055, partial [Polyangiaceae bacterium]|nr:hypothetical protein [Polyangiaceae bacterium]